MDEFIKLFFFKKETFKSSLNISADFYEKKNTGMFDHFVKDYFLKA